LNWIVKDKILAFAGPHFRRNVSPEGYCTLTPQDYIPYFKKKHVALVVRLNMKCYEESEFIKAGIAHVEHYYLDGSCPPMAILDKVLAAFEKVPPNKAFSVHCKAGLGRTGTCIGAYIMKHYRFTAPEVIAWMRICRPGMVIGPQQQFLQDIEQRMWHEGSIMHSKPTQDAKLMRSAELQQQDGSPKSVMASPMHFESLTVRDQRNETVTGRPGQADSLLAARRNQAAQQQERVSTPGSTSGSSSSASRRLFES
jgi:protein-tyrosine phosphatase